MVGPEFIIYYTLQKPVAMVWPLYCLNKIETILLLKLLKLQGEEGQSVFFLWFIRTVGLSFFRRMFLQPFQSLCNAS
jgi:hypothetical protein